MIKLNQKEKQKTDIADVVWINMRENWPIFNFKNLCKEINHVSQNKIKEYMIKRENKAKAQASLQKNIQI